MRNRLLGLWVCLLVAGAAAGDVVFLKNGKSHRGQVTREGNKVLIRTALATIAVDAKDVEKIIKSDEPSEPVVESSAAPTVTLDTRSPEDRYVRPESHAFAAMRQLAATGGFGGENLREQINTWRAKAHDSERKVRGKWYSIKDIELAREEFAAQLKRARPVQSQILRAGATTAAGRTEQARLRRTLAPFLRQAALAWPDDLISEFLLGVAQLESLNHIGAQQIFKRLAAAAPRVGAFRQGQALALAGREMPLEALSACLEALQLQPDSREAMQLVSEAIESTPGKLMAETTYVTAKAIMELYDASAKKRYAMHGTNWLMPGRTWMGREFTLPTPPCDRLTFRQAVGVPVGANALLVDRTALSKAAEVFVAIAPGIVVPGRSQSSGGGGGSGMLSAGGPSARKKDAPPVELVYVDDFTFTPLPAADPKAAKGQTVTAYGLGIYEEMGSDLRTFEAVVEADAKSGQITLSQKLLAGEVSAPVVTKTGQLLGFLQGKTDVAADGGGGDRFVGVEEMSHLVKRAGRSSTGGFGSYSRVKRKITPKPAAGRHFVVFTTATEGPVKKAF